MGVFIGVSTTSYVPLVGCILFEGNIMKYWSENLWTVDQSLQCDTVKMCMLVIKIDCLIDWLVDWYATCKISSTFREKNKVVEFPFPFHIFMPLANLWLILLQG